MTKVYYKATRPDGTDFYSGTIDYAAVVGGSVKAPSAPRKGGYECCTDGVLHASDTPSETLVGGHWPCRLLEVTGSPVAQDDHKFGFRSLTVVREIEAWRALGPNGREVAAMIDQTDHIVSDEARALATAWKASREAVPAAAEAALVAAVFAARSAAFDAANVAALSAAWRACRAVRSEGHAAEFTAGIAARALVVSDLITPKQFDLLYGPWASVMNKDK